MRTKHHATHSSAYKLQGSNISTLAEPRPTSNYKAHSHQHTQSSKPRGPYSGPHFGIRTSGYYSSQSLYKRFQTHMKLRAICGATHDHHGVPRHGEHHSTPTTPGYTTSLKRYPHNCNLQSANNPNRIAQAGPNRAGAAATPRRPTSPLTGHRTRTKETRTYKTAQL